MSAAASTTTRRRTTLVVTIGIVGFILAAAVTAYAVTIHSTRQQERRRSGRVRALIQGLVLYQQKHAVSPTSAELIDALIQDGFVDLRFASDAASDLHCPAGVPPYLVGDLSGSNTPANTVMADDPAICENPDAVVPDGGFVGFYDNHVVFVAADALRSVAKHAIR